MPKNARGWFRYRLRTLLALITLAALGLGGYKAYVEPFRIQKRAVEQLAAIGAMVEYRAAGPAWLERLFGQEHFQDVVSVKLEHRRFADKDLAPLRDLPHLERLYLAQTPVTDEGLLHLATLGRLRRMSLWNTRISDAGIARLAGLTELEVLDVHNTRLTEAALEPLREHPRLVSLIHSISVGDAGVEALVSMPRLRPRSLLCTEISDEGLRQVARLRGLKSLVIRSSWATDAGLADLTHLSRLESLELRHCAATDAAIAQLARLPVLKTLRIDGIPITGGCLQALAAHRHLASLELSDTDIRFEALARHFGGSATWLQISAAEVRQRGGSRTVRLAAPILAEDIEQLEHFTSLESLVLGRPPFDFARAGCLERLADLRTLEINLTLDDRGAELLGRLSRLQRLTLSGRQAISPSGFLHLARLDDLSDLKLRSCGLTDEHLAFLTQLGGLQVLEVPGNRISSAGMEHLRNLSQLRRLNVSFCRDIDDEALIEISALASLQDLSAQDTQVTDAGLDYLFDMPYLQSVTVLGSRATQGGLRRLRGALQVKGGTIY